jgi:DNA gyrase subunit B
MRPLIERGHIYIAQPPLYKVKKGKFEAYFDNEEKLQKWQLKEALSGISIKAKGKKLEVKEIGDLVELIIAADNTSRKLETKNLTLKDYLKFQADGKVPMYRVETGPETYRYFFTEDEWDAYETEYVKTKKDALAKAAVVVEGEAPAEIDEDDLGPDFQTLGEFTRLNNISAKLKALGHSLNEFQVEDEKAPALFDLITEKTITSSKDLKTLMENVMKAGAAGAHIQRYKGLGEMNPGQLWETTMDPLKRKLLKVTHEDQTEAEKMFTTLMGDKVEPRRLFIEQNALAARNLDI